MLDATTKKRIDDCRDILVGKVPDPKSQVEQITIALIYKFMDDMDAEAEELGGQRSFFTGEYARFGWAQLMAPGMGGFEVLALYSAAIQSMRLNPGVPELFRDIFKNAYLPYRDPETLKSFLKEINGFTYDHSERLGDAFEYLLSVLGSQGDAGQFRTPRHIIDFVVEIVSPEKSDTILDPACGTAGFLIAAYKHILKSNSPPEELKRGGQHTELNQAERTLESPSRYSGRLLTPDQRARVHRNLCGYDISPDMVRLSLVNMYLHGFASPTIFEYDSLTSEDNWHKQFDVILANPPFMTPKGGIKPHKHFSITSRRAELLFVDYIAEHLSVNGKGGVIVPEGVMFVEQGAFTEMRRKLVGENILLAVVTLPHGVFKPYASVKTHILILDKRLARKTDKILFLEVLADGYTQSDTRLSISDDDIPEALHAIREFKKSVEHSTEYDEKQVGCEACLVDKSRILANRFAHLIGRWYRLESEFGRLADSQFPVGKVGDCCDIRRGAFPNMATLPGDFPLVVPAPDRKSAESYDFDDEGVCVPLVSSSGHGKADIKRLHYQEGRFALADTMCCLVVRDKSMLRPKYLYEILSENKEKWLVPLMSGATNVTLNPDDLKNVVIPIPAVDVQDSIIEGISLDRMILELDGVRVRMAGVSTSDEKIALGVLIDSLVKKRNRCISIRGALTKIL